jgi:ATP-binding cassette, subfamily C (CFTR/MRP), member 1
MGSTVADEQVDLEQHDASASVQLQHRLLTPLLGKKIPPIPHEEERKSYGEYHANQVSRMMFAWMYPLLNVGYKRTLTENDLFKLDDRQTIDHMYGIFKTHLQKYVHSAMDKHIREKYEKEGKVFDSSMEVSAEELEGFKLPSYTIPLCLLKTMMFEYCIGNIFKTLSDVSACLAPLLQKKLINFVEFREIGNESSVNKGVGYAIGVCLLVFADAICFNHAFHYFMTCGAKARGILTRLLLDKALSVDAKGAHEFPASKLQSLLSTDLNRIDFAIGYFPFMLSAFVPAAICIGLLIWNIGVSSLVGVGVFVVVILIIGSLFQKLMDHRETISKYTDIRVKLMKELLKSYKMIKFYSWENSYSQRIQDARFKEMKHVLTLQGTRSFLVSVTFAMPALASMATFCTAFDISGSRSAASIFSSLSLFQILSFQFILVPLAVSATADMFTSCKKISELLTTRNIKENEFQLEYLESPDVALRIEDASFIWETFEELEQDNEKNECLKKEVVTDEKFIDVATEEKTVDTQALSTTNFPGLRNVNMEIRKGEFVVVTGSIGSGKSSLLSAMAGLMKKTSGKIFVDGELLLCGYPWVQNTTIRENITFGLPFDEKKYQDVVESCSLYTDLAQFPGGDMTEVGERGITLSGGQKARINLARAVYADKDIILLDDVLSAVDAKVGKHIVEDCMQGLLRSKTRIMATHQLGLISQADRLIFLNGDGSVEIGTTEELLATNAAFFNLFQFQKSTNKDSASDHDDEKLKREDELKLQPLEVELKDVFSDAAAEAENFHQNTVSKEDSEWVRIVGDEERAVNALHISVYMNYCRLAFGKHWWFSLAIFLLVSTTAVFCDLFTNAWLSFWIENKFKGRSTGFYMGLYVMFSFLYGFFISAMFYLTCYYTNEAAKQLNFKAVQRMLHVPMTFMDISPLGRVLNRFTKDTDVLDNELEEQIRQFLYPFAIAVGIVILCVIYIPWFAIAIPLILILYVIVINYYQASAREIKRLEAIQRSSVYSHFNEVLSGKDTIKAYHSEERVKERLNGLIDRQNEAYFLTLVSQRWLGVTLALLGFFIVFVISMLCVFRVFNIGAASTGLLLTYIINLIGIVAIMMLGLTQVENEFNSVERLNHYAFNLAQEAAYEIPENDPPPSWPAHGSIIFKNVSMQYRPELPYVLKNINLNIGKAQKVGLCGRTGAGKSTFMTCLYRFTEFEGDIFIDGIDIKTLGLHTLRKNLTIIPQDPVLFIGNIRDNLDPFGDHSDEMLWEALCIASLIDKEEIEIVKSQRMDDQNLHKFHLNRAVEDDGANFSIGERQLIALARALVRKSKILILDEATSSVDYETDSKIQKTITTEFANCTILCIAHRLNTILSYDKIAVMDDGRLVEFDEPRKLFLQENSQFRAMCRQAKISISDFE